MCHNTFPLNKNNKFTWNSKENKSNAGRFVFLVTKMYYRVTYGTIPGIDQCNRIEIPEID